MGWTNRNGKKYWVEYKVVGHRLNEQGIEVPERKVFYGRTKKECLAKIEEYSINKAMNKANSKKAFGVLADSWIDEYFKKDGSLADSTKSMYIRYWNKHIKPMDFYAWPISNITGTTIQKAYNDLFEAGVPSSTIAKCNKLMRKFIAYLTLHNLCIDFSSSLVVPKKPQEAKEANIVVWSDDEIETIFSNFDKADYRFRMRFLIVLAYYTGCRIGELLALTRDDVIIDGNKGTLIINKQLGETVSYDEAGNVIVGYGLKPPKSDKSVRTIPLNKMVIEEYKRHLEWQLDDMKQNGYITRHLFTTQHGTLYYQRNIRRALKRYYDAIGIEEKGIHCYRHTFGTNLCKNGVPIQVASSLLGHESIETTARYYVNIDADEKTRAIETLSKVLVG